MSRLRGAHVFLPASLPPVSAVEKRGTASERLSGSRTHAPGTTASVIPSLRKARGEDGVRLCHSGPGAVAAAAAGGAAAAAGDHCTSAGCPHEKWSTSSRPPGGAVPRARVSASSLRPRISASERMAASSALPLNVEKGVSIGRSRWQHSATVLVRAPAAAPPSVFSHTPPAPLRHEQSLSLRAVVGRWPGGVRARAVVVKRVGGSAARSLARSHARSLRRASRTRARSPASARSPGRRRRRPTRNWYTRPLCRQHAGRGSPSSCGDEGAAGYWPRHCA